MEQRDGTPPKDAADRLIDQLEREGVFNLDHWRREVVTMLDDWLYFSNELATLERASKELTGDEKRALAMQLLARARQYIQDESKQVDPRLSQKPPVIIQGELLWHDYSGTSNYKAHRLPEGCEIRGHYFDCDVGAYYTEEAVALSDQEREAYRRSIGAHMVVFHPIICDSATGEVIERGEEFIFVPLHYENATFKAVHVDA